MGRPSQYRADYHPQVMRELAMLGVTDEKVAKILNTTVTTLNNWRRKHAEFLVATMEGREIADGKVANALYQRAVGASHPEEKLFQHNGEILRAETTKHYPPDTAAAAKWLAIRQPDKWRDSAHETAAVPTQVVLNINVPETVEPEERAIEAEVVRVNVV